MKMMNSKFLRIHQSNHKKLSRRFSLQINERLDHKIRTYKHTNKKNSNKIKAIKVQAKIKIRKAMF